MVRLWMQRMANAWYVAIAVVVMLVGSSGFAYGVETDPLDRAGDTLTRLATPGELRDSGRSQPNSFLKQAKKLSRKMLTNGAFRVGINIGATAPLGIPEGVRVVSYAPGFTPVIALQRDFNIISWFYITTGVQFEYKGMRTRAAVHDYYTEVVQDDGESIIRFVGKFTGENVSMFNASYATLPLLLGFRITPGYAIEAGGYVSWAFSKHFRGSVENGYTWTEPEEGSSNSTKIKVSHADFDFSGHLRSWDAGVQVAGSHRLTEHFFLYAGLTVSVPTVFKPGFNGVTFPMRNIYATMSLGYRFFQE